MQQAVIPLFNLDIMKVGKITLTLLQTNRSQLRLIREKAAIIVEHRQRKIL